MYLLKFHIELISIYLQLVYQNIFDKVVCFRSHFGRLVFWKTYTRNHHAWAPEILPQSFHFYCWEVCSRKNTLLVRTFTFTCFFFFFFKLNGDSLHARLNSRYKAWSYKKKKHKKIKAPRKSAYKEPTVKRCLLISGLKIFRS